MSLYERIRGPRASRMYIAMLFDGFVAWLFRVILPAVILLPSRCVVSCLTFVDMINEGC